MKHKIGFYIRVSTDEQAQVIEGSLDSQKHRLKLFLEIKNAQSDGLWGDYIESYTDEGLSAKDTKRPAFQRMLKDIRLGKINLILVTDLSRLSRNILDFCVLMEDLKKANAKFLSIKEQFDTSTPAGEMMIYNMINLAQFERKQTSERVSMNFHARALRGLRNGGSNILGFDTDPSNPSTYIVNEAEAVKVRRIFELYKEECSSGRTIDRLKAECIFPKARQGRVDRHVQEGRWTNSSLRSILRNYAYIGLREVNKGNQFEDIESLKSYQKYQRVKASWPAIVSEEDFLFVQETLDRNFKIQRTRLLRAKSRVFLLSGIIYCEECGKPMKGSSAHGAVKVHRYYTHKTVKGESIDCKLKHLPATTLEASVLNHLDEVLLREGYLENITGRLDLAIRQSEGDTVAEKRRLEFELTKINAEVHATIRLVTEMKKDGVDDLLRQTLVRLNERKEDTESQLNFLSDKLQNVFDITKVRSSLETKVIDFKKAQKKATPALLKQLLHKIITGISVGPEKVKIAYWVGAGDRETKQVETVELEKTGTYGGTAPWSNRHRTMVPMAAKNNVVSITRQGGTQGVGYSSVVWNGGANRD